MHELRMEKLSAEAEVLKGVGPSSYPFREVEKGLKTAENGCERRREGWIQVTVLTEMGGFLAHLERELAETKGDRDRLERELREHKAGKGARRPSHSLSIDEALRISWFLWWKAMESRSSWHRKASNTLRIGRLRASEHNFQGPHGAGALRYRDPLQVEAGPGGSGPGGGGDGLLGRHRHRPGGGGVPEPAHRGLGEGQGAHPEQDQGP